MSKAEIWSKNREISSTTAEICWDVPKICNHKAWKKSWELIKNTEDWWKNCWEPSKSLDSWKSPSKLLRIVLKLRAEEALLIELNPVENLRQIGEETVKIAELVHSEKKMRHFQINLFLRKKRWFFTFENVAESVNFSRIFSTLKPLNKVINESEHVKKMFNNPLHTSFLWSFQIKGSESWEKWVACSPWKTFSSGNVPCDLPHLDIFKAHKCQP